MSVPFSNLRLDLALVERGLVPTRQKAQALILAGDVTVNGQRHDKPGHAVCNDDRIALRQSLKYVGRGGLKLEAALERFRIEVTGKICLDIGTSTGGFTDCLLQHGAARVHAVDTGAGQIDWKLRTDERVTLHENVNARYLSAGEIGEAIELAVCDVSFISVLLILPAILPLLTASAELVILIKPQFEVGRELVGKGGIVRDENVQADACARVAKFFTSRHYMTNLTESPITGAEGNREFLLYAHLTPDPDLLS